MTLSSCDDISIDQFLLLFSSLSMWLLVFHLEYHCIVSWLIRLTNCLKMGWSLRPKCRYVGNTWISRKYWNKEIKLYFFTPYCSLSVVRKVSEKLVDRACWSPREIRSFRFAVWFQVFSFRCRSNNIDTSVLNMPDATRTFYWVLVCWTS